MDPITLMAAVTAAFNGVKRAVEIGREIQDVYSELGRWAEAADGLRTYISNNENKKPGLFESISFSKSASAEALDMSAAKVQLQRMEEEIRHMFFYGELQALGMAGYREFIENRREIRARRDRMVREQVERRRKFLESAFWGTILAVVLSLLIYSAVIVYDLGTKAGRW